MIITHKSINYTINVDWLQFSVLLHRADDELKCPEDMRLELLQGNNIFERRAMLFSGDGEKIMTLLWKPYSKVLSPLLMTCQIDNHLLYISGAIKMAYELLAEMVECTFNSVGRFDLCIDFVASEQHIQFMKHLNSGHYYVQGKKEGSVWWHETTKDNFAHKEMHCLSWGSKKSEIKVKIYNKSREQGVLNPTSKIDDAEKPYIVAEWEEAAMDIHRVWRLEFSFCTSGQLQFENKAITLEMIDSREFIIDTLLTCLDKRFVCRINQGRRQGHKNNDRRVWLLNLPPRRAKLNWAAGSDYEGELPASIKLLRSMMTQLDNPCLMCHRPTFETYATAIMDIVRDHKLDGYFKRTWEADCETYFNERWQEIGTGTHKTIASPKKLME